MKRPRTIALLVLLLALAGTAAVLCGIQGTMRHAAVTETTLFGDASAAEGVELCFGGTSDSKLSWEHRWRFGGSGTLDPAETDADRAQQNALHVQSTSFTCGNPQEQEAVTLAWPNLKGCVDTGSLSSSLRFLWSNPIDPDNAALTEEEQAGTTEEAKRRAAVRSYFTPETPTILQDLQHAFDTGEQTKAEIRMQDLLRYYRLKLELTGQDNHVLDVRCSEFAYIADTETHKNYVSTAEQESFALWESLNRFFRIPVLESESRILEAERNSIDSLGGAWLSYELDRAKKNADSFSFETIACGTPEAVYFTFDPHSYRGELVDTSMIPGGYGLYRLPYDSEKNVFLPEKLKMVYPLDPTRDYVSIHSSPDGQKLLLTSRAWQFGDTKKSSRYEDADSESVTKFDRERRLTAEVVNLASMTCEKSLDVLQSRYEIQCRDAGDYLVFSDAVSKICVIAYQDGSYHKTLDLADLAMASRPDEDLPCYGYLKQMAYDGERLVLAGHSYVKADYVQESWDWSPQSDAELAVYDRRGLAYFGRLTDNLQDYTEEQGFVQWAEALKIKLPAARYAYRYGTPESALNVMTWPTDIKVTISAPSAAA